MVLWRHGDILIQTVESIPKYALKIAQPVLAEGEATGHRHRIQNRRAACLYQNKYLQGEMFLDVVQEFANLVHPEHDTIRLPKGQYRIWRQREYTDYGTRPIGD